MTTMQIGERSASLTGEGLIQQFIEAGQVAAELAVAEAARDSGRDGVRDLVHAGEAELDFTKLGDLSEVQKDRLGRDWFDAEARYYRTFASAHEYERAMRSPDRETPSFMDYDGCRARIKSLLPVEKGVIVFQDEVHVPDEFRRREDPTNYKYLRNDAVAEGEVGFSDERHQSIYGLDVTRAASRGILYLYEPEPVRFGDRLRSKYSRRYKVEVVHPETREPQVEIEILEPPKDSQ